MTNEIKQSTNRVTIVTTAVLLLVALAPASAQRLLERPGAPVLLRTSDETHCLYQDYHGYVWRCTDRGIVRFDGRTEVTFATGNLRPKAIVRGSGFGQYWVGTASGLYEMSYEMRSDGAAPNTVRLEPVVTDRPVGGVNGLIDLSEGSIGCATDDGALRIAGGRVTEIPLGLPDDRAGRIVNVLLEPDPSVLLAGTTTGLYVHYRDGRTRRFTTSDGLPDNNIQALAFTLGGDIWIGTRRGLAIIDQGQLNSGSPRPIHDSKLLRDADVRGLAASGVFVWVGTSAGLFVVPAFRSGSADLQQYFSDTVSSHVLIRGPEGIVATGRPQSNNRDNSEGTVITGITVDGQSWPTPFLRTKRARLTLPWRARLVEIRFVNPRVESQSSGAYLIRTGRSDGLGGSFSDIPEPWTQMRISNAGQIRGDIFVPLSRDDAAVTANWPRRRDMGPIVLRRSRGDSPASAFMSRHIATADENGWLWLPDEAERRIVIEHPSRTLAPGLHRVVVYANAGGRGDSASVEFVVAQAPWVRWWFAGPILVALTGAGVTYRRRRRRRTEEIARLRARIAADLHDSVGASLSRIAILSDVVASQVGGHVPKAGSSLKAIGENARSAIDEMSDAVWFIDPGSRNVGDMLARIRTVAAELFEPDLVSWSVDAEARVSDVPLTSEQRRHAYLIVKEALTNVRRHAEPSLVQVRLTMTTTGLRIEIDDDGDAPIPISVERAGNGIANMRARAQELGGTLAIEPRPGGGTRVVVQTTLR